MKVTKSYPSSPLLNLIVDYDLQREAVIEDLRERLAVAEDKYAKLLDDNIRGIRERERATLDLIMSGALVVPKDGTP